MTDDEFEAGCRRNAAYLNETERFLLRRIDEARAAIEVWQRKAQSVQAEIEQFRWRSIEDRPKGEVLLYFPAEKNDRYGHGALASMTRVGRIISFPYRQPTHWMPAPKPPEEETKK